MDVVHLSFSLKGSCQKCLLRKVHQQHHDNDVGAKDKHALHVSMI